MENAKALGIKLLTWYCNRRQDHPDVRRGTSKLDASEDCMRWDCSVEPLVKVALQQCKADLASIWPAYWEKWDNVHLPALEASSAKLTQERVTSELVQKMVEYVRRHKSWGRRKDFLKYADRCDLHQKESDVLCTLSIQWSRFGEKRVAVLHVVEKYAWHFTCRDV